MFLQINDLKNNIYNYQVDQITEGDNTIVLQGLAAAEEECRSYLESNIYQKENQDGRLIYDVETIFGATGTDRNALILQHCITIAKYHIIQLSNVDILYEQAKERYDRAIDWLTKLAKGQITLKSLPTIEISDEDENLKPFSFGSRKKFNHE
ncbi:MAG: phage protein Gp36 family protein [Flavobacteriaceae bacterium]